MAAQTALPARVDRSEADFARVASEVAELRAAVFALKSWTDLQWDSPVTDRNDILSVHSQHPVALCH
jgi:hypothetical protein